MKFFSYWHVDCSREDVFEPVGDSLTVPDQSFSIQELLIRASRGMPIPTNPRMYYEEGLDESSDPDDVVFDSEGGLFDPLDAKLAEASASRVASYLSKEDDSKDGSKDVGVDPEPVSE